MKNKFLYKAFNEEKTLGEFCEEYNIKKSSVFNRLRKGMTLEKALITPLENKGKRFDIFIKGKVFNNFLQFEKLIKNDGNGHKIGLFKCLTGYDNCNHFAEIRLDHILNDNVSSCGCLGKAKGKNHRDWKGCGEISGSLFCRIKLGCKRKTKNLEFTITIEEIWNLFLKQERKCAFSGVELKFNTKWNTQDGNASLDRIDSSKGYVPGNVQWIHKDLQRMKMDFSDEEFISWSKKIANFRK